jgi:hypothetical protein
MPSRRIMSAVVPGGVEDDGGAPTIIVLAMLLDDRMPSVTIQLTVLLRSVSQSDGLPLVELKAIDSNNASIGVLTLTGSASLANYQTALASITFSSTSGNPSNSRTDPSRTVSWTVIDGTLSSNTITSTIAINSVPPVLSGDRRKSLKITNPGRGVRRFQPGRAINRRSGHIVCYQNRTT